MWSPRPRPVASLLEVKSLALLTLLTFSLKVGGSGHRWNYKANSTYGPLGWAEFYPDCGGKYQSPIDIDTSVTTHVTDWPKLEFVNYIKPVPKLRLHNNGHTVKLELPKATELRIRGITMHSWFALHQIHFHWGETDDVGSEHLINGKSYPLEVHLVHMALNPEKEKFKYNVIAILCEISEDENEIVAETLGRAVDVQYKRESVVFDNFLNISRLLPSQDPGLYHYIGSFTTPPCTEGVSFVIYKEKCKVSPYQLGIFRALYQSSSRHRPQHLLHNFRPVQPVNDREIFYVTAPGVGAPAKRAGNTSLAADAPDYDSRTSGSDRSVYDFVNLMLLLTLTVTSHSFLGFQSTF